MFVLEQLIKLYWLATTYDVRSPMPHIVGPPGASKSTTVHELAETVGCKVHTLNVSRLSPLEVEGLQIPHETESKLKLLVSNFWSNLNDGDIILLEEFLRGFPEVYNSLLDIFTAREVAGFKLPNVFIVGTSNTDVAYDQALQDRLLHIYVPDMTKTVIRSNAVSWFLSDAGLCRTDQTLVALCEGLFLAAVVPLYQKQSNDVNNSHIVKGSSARKLMGELLLRTFESLELSHFVNRYNSELLSLASVGGGSDLKKHYVVHDAATAEVWLASSSSERDAWAEDADVSVARNVQINNAVAEMFAARREHK